MASGQPVVQIVRELQPVTTGAIPVTFVGTSTPAERFFGWRFDDAANAFMDYLIRLQGYAGGGLTIQLAHVPLTGTPGNAVRISAAIRRIQDDAEDLDTTAHTYDYNAATLTTASALGEVAYDTIAFTNGVDMDSLAEGELGVLRIRREPADAADTLAGNWLLLAVSGIET